MNAKSDMLARIRRNLPQATPLPELDEAWIAYPDREAQFIEVLKSVGGAAMIAERGAALDEIVKTFPCMEGAQQIVCTLPEVSLGNVKLDDIDDPHDLGDVDVAILTGEFAVAENAAVYVTDRGIKHRAVYFLTQHLVLVVPRSEMLDHMHQAYDRISFEGAGYGLFIAGPSKTADIEQSLVIGAHGPKSLTVILRED